MRQIIFMSIFLPLLFCPLASADKPKLDPDIAEQAYYEELYKEFVPQSTPGKSFQLELKMMQQRMYCYDLPLFDPEWRRKGKKIQLSKVFQEVAKKADQPFEVIIDDKHAVLYFKDRSDMAPVFFYQDEQGWVIDRGTAGRKLFMSPSEHTWAIKEGTDPYFQIIKKHFPLRAIATDKTTKDKIFEIKKDANPQTEPKT